MPRVSRWIARAGSRSVSRKLPRFRWIYIYEFPTHHCPFDILQKEYGAVVAGMGVGVLTPFRSRGSMSQVIPALACRLTLISWVLYLLFTLIVSYKIVLFPFRLGP